MSLLIKPPKYQKSTQIDMVNFSKINDMKAPDTYKKPKDFEKPVKEVIKKPPVAPKLDLTTTSSSEGFILPAGLAPKISPELIKIALPSLVHPDIGFSSNNADLVQLLAIQPMYPPIAARNKIEGWVKVEFIVNEFGKVTKAKVIEAKPRGVFNTATLKAIYKSKFKPLMVDGKAVPQVATQIIEFKLEQ